MPLTDAARNIALDAIGDVAAWASLHSDDPGSTGANELIGGLPAYSRQPISWNPASAGDLDSNVTPVFDVPGSSTVAAFGLWDAPVGGTFYGSGELVQETFAGQGTYTLLDADLILT